MGNTLPLDGHSGVDNKMHRSVKREYLTTGRKTNESRKEKRTGQHVSETTADIKQCGQAEKTEIRAELH